MGIAGDNNTVDCPLQMGRLPGEWRYDLGIPRNRKKKQGIFDTAQIKSQIGPPQRLQVSLNLPGLL